MALPFDTISTTTLQLIRRRMADNIFKANPTLAFLLMRGRVRSESGGRFIQEPLMYATNGTVQAYRGYDRLNVAPTEELTSAQYSWRQLAVSIGISGLEELENSGEGTKIFDLLRQKVKVAELSMRQHMDEKVHATSSSKDLSLDFLGLDELVEAAVGGSQSTIGGIDRQTHTWWQNKFTDVAAQIAASDSTSLTNHMTNMYHTAGLQVSRPDLIITDQDVFERYENDNRTLLRLSDTRLMDVGFDNLKFKGAVMMWNENIRSAPGGANHHLIYFLATEFLGFVLHPRRNFAMSSFVSPYDQDARVAQILVAGNMTLNNSRHQGVLQVDIAGT